MITVLIVDDHPLLGEGTRRLIDEEPDMQAVFVASAEAALDTMRSERFDLCLYDMNLPGMNGLELARLTSSELPILIYSGFDVSADFEALVRAGVIGIVEKTASPRQLIRSLRSALDGFAVLPASLLHRLSLRGADNAMPDNTAAAFSAPLTDKERLILEGVQAGRSNKELAEALFISQRTVEYNLTGIFAKLNVHSRAEAVLAARKLGAIGDVPTA